MPRMAETTDRCLRAPSGLARSKLRNLSPQVPAGGEGCRSALLDRCLQVHDDPHPISASITGAALPATMLSHAFRPRRMVRRRIDLDGALHGPFDRITV